MDWVAKDNFHETALKSWDCLIAIWYILVIVNFIIMNISNEYFFMFNFFFSVQYFSDAFLLLSVSIVNFLLWLRIKVCEYILGDYYAHESLTITELDYWFIKSRKNAWYIYCIFQNLAQNLALSEYTIHISWLDKFGCL